MKKALLTVATLGVTILPAVGAHAQAYNGYPGTDISASQNTSNYLDANKSDVASSSNTTYYNQKVDYLALYLVKYSANTTYYTNNMQKTANRASLVNNYNDNRQSRFSMPYYYYYTNY